MVADRAYLKGARIGEPLGRLEAELDRILSALGSTGAIRVEPEALQPADVLLDLYGEDIRARAFVVRDEGGEMMLRPDFTVPIVRLHMDAGAEPARYAYCGPVWRRQDTDSMRPREYLQAGFEIFEQGDAAAQDAEVLGVIRDALGDAPIRMVTGDLGLVLAAIDALPTSAPRKAALRRHVWRPRRFLALLDRYGEGHAAARVARADLLEAAATGKTLELIGTSGVALGLRDVDEVAARVTRLAAEAETDPLAAEDVDRLEAVLGVEGSAPEALDQLRSLSRGLPQLDAAVDRYARRLEALAARGINPDGLRFEGSFGRTTLEYYDGFVFGALPIGREDLPPIAAGGRYDALTRVLGQGSGIPAVGGIVRPEALLALRGGGC